MIAYQKLGLLLKRKRTEVGITQSALADKLGDMHPQFVSNWERGLCAPPDHSFHRLISVLGVHKEELVSTMISDYKLILEKKIYGKKLKKRSK